MGAISDVEDEESPDYAGKKRLIVILLLAYSVVSGSLSYFIPEEDQLLDYLSILPSIFLAFYWCTTDAAERDYEIGVGMKLLLVLLLAVGLPVYLLQTRGLSGFRSIGWALLLFIGMLACSFMGEFVALHAQEVADQVVWRVSDQKPRLVAGTFHVPSAKGYGTWNAPATEASPGLLRLDSGIHPFADVKLDVGRNVVAH